MSTHAHFYPAGATKRLAVTATTGSTTLPDVGTQGGDIHFFNFGPNVCFITFGSGSATAVATTSFPIGINESIIMSMPANGTIDTVAAICASTETAALHMTAGHGGL